MVNLSQLNPQQRLAVQTIHGPLLILAGAGTGKTRVVTCRIAHMIAQGIAPEQILAVTFTNKAAREMLERTTRLLPRPARNPDTNPSRRPTLCTFHSLCVRILRQHIEALGYKRNFVIYNEADQLGLIKKILSHISTPGQSIDPAATLAALSRSRNAGSEAESRDHDDTTAMAAHIACRYESALRACNAVDFDDLILLTLRLFREHPRTLEASRAKYRYVMVDEFQDTNAAQFKLVDTLTREHRNICVVGDDDQSIYGWRGAEIANLLDMERHFPDVKVIKLEQNYRSTGTILEAANAVIAHNTRRRAKRLWSARGTGDRITLHTFANEEEEALTIIDELEFLRHARRVPWKDQAVLFRTNQQSRPLEAAFRKAGVRYHLVGGQSFFDRREVKDFLAYLKLLFNPHDDVSLLRVANVPARGFSDATLQRLIGASQERNCSVYTAMLDPAVQARFPARTRNCINAFAAFVDSTRTLLTCPTTINDPHLLQSWSTRFLAEIGYMDAVRRFDKDAETAENRVRNLLDLMATMDDGERNRLAPAERLQAFLEELTLDTDREEETETHTDAVTLITMHSCKGLEFPHVFIVGMEDGLLPHSRSRSEGTLDEERRLFYVAITRARESLTISHCAGRKKYGKIVPCHPSPFLNELPEDLVVHADERSNELIPVQAGKDLFNAMRTSIDP